MSSVKFQGHTVEKMPIRVSELVMSNCIGDREGLKAIMDTRPGRSY